MKYTSLFCFVIATLSLSVVYAQDDVVVSIGELETPGDCYSATTPIVIPIPDITEKEIPINICNLAGRQIDVTEFRIAYNPDIVNVTAYRRGEIVHPDWTFMPNPQTGLYIIGISNLTMFDPVPITEDGVIVYLTFEAVSDNPTLMTSITFELARLEDTEPGLPIVQLPVTTVDNDVALPVVLSAFGAIWHMREGIKIFWEATSQKENLGWNIYRSETKDGEFVKINGKLIEGAGTTSNPMKYSFIDKDAEKGKLYYYYLEDISFNGEKHLTPAIRTTSVNKITSWGAIKRSVLR
jgi:hypothetical protein